MAFESFANISGLCLAGDNLTVGAETECQSESPGLFDYPPTIDLNGTLRLAAGRQRTGWARCSVRLAADLFQVPL